MSEPANTPSSPTDLGPPIALAVLLAAAVCILAWVGRQREHRIEQLNNTMPPQLLNEDNANANVLFDPTRGLLLFGIDELRAAESCEIPWASGVLQALEPAQAARACEHITAFMAHVNDFATKRDHHELSDRGFERMIRAELDRLEARLEELTGADSAAALITALEQDAGLGARIERSIQAISADAVQQNNNDLLAH